MRTKIIVGRYCKQYCGGACRVKTSGFREVCWFHLLFSSSTTNNQGLDLLRAPLALSSSPCLPGDWNISWVVIFSLSFIWFPRFLGPLQWLKAECMHCRGSVQNSSLHPFLHSKNSSGQCKNLRNPTPNSGAVQQQRWGQTTDLPLNGRHVSRTGLLLNYWFLYIFPRIGNKVYCRNRLLGLRHWV